MPAKMMNKDMEKCCMAHKRGHGLKALVLGLIVLINVYRPFIGWGMLIGILLVLVGLVKLLVPCHCCKK